MLAQARNRAGNSTGESVSLRLRRLLLPVERAFFQRVDIPDHQDRNETQHAPEDRFAFDDRFFVNDRPRIHEHDLEIEQDEEHRDEVELHAEARLGFALRDHAAFVGRVLNASASAGLAEKDADEQRGDSKPNRHHDLQQQWEVIAQSSVRLESRNRASALGGGDGIAGRRDMTVLRRDCRSQG